MKKEFTSALLDAIECRNQITNREILTAQLDPASAIALVGEAVHFAEQPLETLADPSRARQIIVAAAGLLLVAAERIDATAGVPMRCAA